MGTIRSGERYALLLRVWNKLRRMVPVRSSTPLPTVDSGLLATRRQAAANPSDISDHLETLYIQTVLARPRLVVELGVRGAESTRTLLRAAEHAEADLISVDVKPADTQMAGNSRWRFVQEDSVSFGALFTQYACEKGLPDRVDVLFLDTSHLFDDTVVELRTWLPLMRAAGVVLLHDTRMRVVYGRRDGTLGYGWDNAGGVVRAVEHVLGGRIDETRSTIGGLDRGWRFAHDPHCSGLTILRVPEERHSGGGWA